MLTTALAVGFACHFFADGSFRWLRERFVALPRVGAGRRPRRGRARASRARRTEGRAVHLLPVLMRNLLAARSSVGRAWRAVDVMSSRSRPTTSCHPRSHRSTGGSVTGRACIRPELRALGRGRAARCIGVGFHGDDFEVMIVDDGEGGGPPTACCASSRCRTACVGRATARASRHVRESRDDPKQITYAKTAQLRALLTATSRHRPPCPRRSTSSRRPIAQFAADTARTDKIDGWVAAFDPQGGMLREASASRAPRFARRWRPCSPKGTARMGSGRELGVRRHEQARFHRR